jgi:xanthine dehydrogenase small subunit
MAVMTPAVRFLHRGAVVEVVGATPTRTVLEWLREDAHRVGTKEGCAEGDCGACTVVVGELDAHAPGGLALRAVNACIRFLPTLHGKALFTVEDVAGVAGEADALHPVQQALVDHHASQCGFCTPGFVMSLWAGYERHQCAGTRPTRQDLADELAGNLCRCTGYRPILDAAQAMFDAPAALLERAAVVQALRAMQETNAAQPAADAAFAAPRDLATFAALRLARPQARVLAGGTDIGLWVTKQLRDPGPMISIAEVAELRVIETDAAHIAIGAAATLADAWDALAHEWPALREMALRFASPPIRNVGTMGGNVANGSPIGDAAPVLMALGAQIVLRRGSDVRSLAPEDFYLGYQRNALREGEFVQALHVPRRRQRQQQVRAYKVSKRFDSDISALCAGFRLEFDGTRVAHARLAFGGMAATVRRAAAAEAALSGQPWAEASVRAAMAALAHDFTPLTDLRASAAYRMQAAQNLLWRLWLQTRPVDPLPDSALNVFARPPQGERPAAGDKA